MTSASVAEPGRLLRRQPFLGRAVPPLAARQHPARRTSARGSTRCRRAAEHRRYARQARNAQQLAAVLRADNRARYPACDALAAGFQSRRVVERIERLCDIELRERATCASNIASTPTASGSSRTPTSAPSCSRCWSTFRPSRAARPGAPTFSTPTSTSSPPRPTSATRAHLRAGQRHLARLSPPADQRRAPVADHQLRQAGMAQPPRAGVSRSLRRRLSPGAKRLPRGARNSYRRRLQGVSTIGWVAATLFFVARSWLGPRRRQRAKHALLRREGQLLRAGAFQIVLVAGERDRFARRSTAAPSRDSAARRCGRIRRWR